MKKAAIILMGICLCLSIPVAAEAAQTGTSSVTQQSTINTTVPDTHMVTIRSEHAQVSYQHEESDDEETQETVTYADRRRKMHPGGADLGQETEKSEWKRRGDPL